MSMKWTSQEEKELERYFKTSILPMTLFQRLHNLNPTRTYEAMSRKLRHMRENGWIKSKEVALKKLRVGYLDIEANNLNANFGFILSWCIKEEGKNNYDYSVITKKEIFNYTFDKRVVSELLQAIKKYDVLYTHYGSDYRFDIPFIRTRAYANGLESELPDYMETFIMDTYPIAKSKLKLHSNRLGSIADVLGIKTKKTEVSPKKWQMACAGHPESLEYIFEHNKIDCYILEMVHKKLKRVERPIMRSI